MRGLITIAFVLLTVVGWSQIRVSQPLQDLGDIFENSGRVTSKFKLTNPYREDTIRIVDVETSCGCTVVFTQDTLIPPLSSIDLEFAYDPSGRLGLFVKSIELTTVTGKDEKNKLFLKVMGNVVAENFTVQKVETELVEYKVAPIYFYPVTVYDTAYLDFNFIADFVNDLTYEIDYYQFTTLGFEVEVRDYEHVEKLTYLLGFVQKKMSREFRRRGFSDKMVFFDEPVFKKSATIPDWSVGTVRLYSVNFDAGETTESSISVTSSENIVKNKTLLDYQRFALPEIDEVVDEVNWETIEGKLFLKGKLSLNGMILMPWKKGEDLRKKTAKQLEKAIRKRIKSTTGAGKKEIKIQFDSLGVHPEDKFRFLLWDEADEEEEELFRLEEKSDQITPPFMPTYKQLYNAQGAMLDTNTQAFRHFWKNCLLNYQAGFPLRFLVESSAGALKEMDGVYPVERARRNGELIIEQLNALFATAFDSLPEMQLEAVVHGPGFALNPTEELVDFDAFEYVNIIPLVHTNSSLKTTAPTPYMVNYDYFFNGIDTGTWGFQRFANYLVNAVNRDGYVEVRIESGISKIPMETNKSNHFLAYTRLQESVRRLKAALAKRLIDPNRIIIKDEQVLQQGPDYDGTIPILRYREFHYIRIIPEKLLD